MEEKHEGAGWRKRLHSIKRWKRAAQHAQKVVDLLQEESQEVILEARAYSKVMEGHLGFEQQDWERSLNAYLTARTLYEQISNLSTSHHLITLCHSAIDEIDPNIRYCGYGLGQATDLQDLLDLSNNHPLLGSQVKQLLGESLSQNKQLQSIVWLKGSLSSTTDLEISVTIENQDLLAKYLQIQRYAHLFTLDWSNN